MNIQTFSPQYPIHKTELQKLAAAWCGDMVKKRTLPTENDYTKQFN